MTTSRSVPYLVALLVIAGAVGLYFMTIDDEGPSTVEREIPTADERVERPAEHGRQASASQAASSTAKADPIEREARSTIRIDGRLVQAGRPLVAVVALVRDRTDGPLLHRHRTNADGAFAFDVAPGPYRLQVDGPTVPIAFRPPVHAPTDWSLGDVHVPLAATMTGRVVGADRVAVAGAKVFFELRGRLGFAFDRSVASTEVHATTDAQGRFRFGRLLAGSPRMLVEAVGHCDSITPQTLVAGRTTNVHIELAEGRSATGQIVGPKGKPVSSALVMPSTRNAAKPRKAVRTDDDGRFFLRGRDGGDDYLTIVHPDYQPRSVGWNPRAPVIALKPAVVLRGVVRGAEGRAVTIRLELDDSLALDPVPDPVWSVLMEKLAVERDGTFAVLGLVEGKYEITATAVNFGASKPVVVTVVPDADPVALRIEPHTFQAVLVRDQDGRAIANARVVSNHSPSSKRHGVRTDTEGRARVIVDSSAPIALAAYAPGCLPSSNVFAKGATPPLVTIDLARGGVVTGRVTVPADHPHMSLGMWRWRGDSKPAAGTLVERIADADANGAFRFSGLPAGEYGVGVHWRHSHTGFAERLRYRMHPTPILDDGIDPRTIQRISVQPGTERNIRITAAPLGRIYGRVYSGGVPTPGAIVFATSGESALGGLLRDQNPDDETTHKLHPNVVTDAEGRFAFRFLRPGTWQFRVRHPAAATAMPPVEVSATAFAQQVRRDLELASGVIRGTFDLRGLTKKQRRFLEVYLFRASEAAIDPFYFAGHSIPETSGMKTATLDAKGRFKFPHVPPGEWVVRVRTALDTLLAQRYVKLRDAARIDLGEIGRERRVNAQVGCIPPDDGDYGVWIRRIVAGSPHRLFARTLSVEKGAVHITDIPPGRYEVELFRNSGSYGMSLGITGEPVGKPRPIEIENDGTVAPATIRFP